MLQSVAPLQSYSNIGVYVGSGGFVVAVVVGVGTAVVEVWDGGGVAVVVIGLNMICPLYAPSPKVGAGKSRSEYGGAGGRLGHPTVVVDVSVVGETVQPIVGTQVAVVHVVVRLLEVGEAVQDTKQLVPVLVLVHEESVGDGCPGPGGGPGGGGIAVGQSVPEQLFLPPIHPSPRHIVQIGPVHPRQLRPLHVSQKAELHPEQSTPYTHC